MKTIDDFTRAYIEAALWSSAFETRWNTKVSREIEEDTHFEEGVYSLSDITQDSMDSIHADCERFQKENEEALAEAYKLYVPRDGYEGASLAGHDFWLTRNRHGVGFWDRNLGAIGDALTQAAKTFRECHVEEDGEGGVIFR